MIKSKKAKECLFEDTTEDKEFQNMDDLIPIHDAVKMGEIIESELYTEVQCVEAFCKHECETKPEQCRFNGRCVVINNFLSALKSLKQ